MLEYTKNGACSTRVLINSLLEVEWRVQKQWNRRETSGIRKRKGIRKSQHQKGQSYVVRTDDKVSQSGSSFFLSRISLQNYHRCINCAVDRVSG